MDKPYRGASDICDRCHKKIEDFYWFKRDMTLRVVQGASNAGVGLCLCEKCTEILGQFMSEERRPPRLGVWERWPYAPVGHNGYHCSLCGAVAPLDKHLHERLTEWCPGCGAQMDLTSVQFEIAMHEERG